MVEPSVIHRSIILVWIKDLAALAPVLIMTTSCFIEMCYLCLREGVVPRRAVCLALCSIFFSATPSSHLRQIMSSTHEAMGVCPMRQGRAVELEQPLPCACAQLNRGRLQYAGDGGNWPFFCEVMGFVQYENLSNGYMQ